MNKKRAIANTSLVLGIAAVGVASWSVVGRGTKATASTATIVTAQTGNVLSSVTGTGNVVAPSQTSVGFDSAVSSNKVASAAVAVGDKVTAGQVLAKVDDTTVAQALTAAQAQLASAQAALDKAQNAVTPDVVAQDAASATQSSLSIQAAEAGVTNAQTSLANDTTSLDAAVAQSQDAYNAAQAKASLDQSNAQASVDNTQAQLDADNAKLATAQTTLTAAQAPVAALTNDKTLCAANTPNPKFVPPDGTACAQVGSELTAATQALTAAQNASDSDTAAVAKDTTGLQSAKASQASTVLASNQSIAQATNAITNAQNNESTKLAADQVAIDNASRQVASARAAYQVTLAGNATKEKVPTADDLAGPQASVVTAQNALATAQRNEDNTTLKSPSAGTIAAMTAQVGQSAGGSGSSGSSSSGSSSSGSSTSGASSSSGSSSGLFTLTDLTSLQVKVGFSESDATNVKVGQAATITFDSLTGVSLTGKVTQLDLTSTTVSNVVTYYAYVTIDPSDSLTRVKPGMTANVVVVVNHADGVVFLPASAVTARGTSATVNVEIANDPNKTTPTPITLGLRGDSSIQIASGLKAGDKIVIVRQAAASGVGTSGAGGARTGAGGGGGGGGAGAGGAGGGAGRVGG